MQAKHPIMPSTSNWPLKSPSHLFALLTNPDQLISHLRLNPIYDMRGGAGGTVDVFGQFESQIQQRSDVFLSGLVAEPTNQPDMLDQKSRTPLAHSSSVIFHHTRTTCDCGTLPVP
jgi:hypothetical protein